jgi:hypothetical protein
VIERKDATEDEAGFQTNPESATSREPDPLIVGHRIERSVPRIFVGTRNQVEANQVAGTLAGPPAGWMFGVERPCFGVVSPKGS